MVVAAALGGVVGCRDRAAPDEPPPPPPITALDAPDAGSSAGDAGVKTLPSYDPASGYHVDPDVGDAPRPSGRTGGRDHRPIQLLLRSTPSGALAAVDGVDLGPTPVLWEGEANGGAHNFTFRLAGHALARYRFVPVTGGIVHGTLVRLLDDELTPELPD